MDFFAHQEQARRKTRLLVLLFVLAVTLIVLAINLVTGLIVYEWSPQKATWSEGGRLQLHFWTSSAVILLIAGASAFRLRPLQKDSRKLADLLGATPVSVTTQDPQEKMLLNVTEEMAIASGSSIPGVFVQKRDGSINALAAGWSQEDAWICVTQGALDHLTRDELQGVVAHEISHILNHDVRLNLRLVGLLFGILCLSKLGWLLLRSTRFRSSSRGRDGGGVVAIGVLGLALLVIGSLGVFFARLIKAATSRQREFLADAFAVQLTRNPAGLGGAFKKIPLHVGPYRDPMAEEISHMYLNAPFAKISSWMASHPPLEARLARLESYLKTQLEEPGQVAPGSQESPRKTPAFTAENLAMLLSPLLPLSEPLQKAAHSPEESKALILAIALSRSSEPPNAEKLKAMELGETVSSFFQANHSLVAKLPASEQNTLLTLASAALKELPEERKKHFLQKVKELIYLDEKMEPQEWAVLAYLENAWSLAAQPPARQRLSTLGQNVQELRLVLTLLAEMSEDFKATYEKGWRALQMAAPAPAPQNRRGGEELLKAVEKLRSLKPLQKKKLVEAFVQMHSHKGEAHLNDAQTFFLHSLLQAVI